MHNYHPSIVEDTTNVYMLTFKEHAATNMYNAILQQSFSQIYIYNMYIIPILKALLLPTTNDATKELNRLSTKQIELNCATSVKFIALKLQEKLVADLTHSKFLACKLMPIQLLEMRRPTSLYFSTLILSLQMARYMCNTSVNLHRLSMHSCNFENYNM